MRPIREGLKPQNINTFKKHHKQYTKNRFVLLRGPNIR
jgi:hypothetical protein